nr:hypothetical protein [Tanacetum cinerariifolium]
MVRLWWLLWPQPARSPPQRWRQTAEHREALLGVASPKPITTWCGCGGCTIVQPPPRWCPTTVAITARKAAAVAAVVVVGDGGGLGRRGESGGRGGVVGGGGSGVKLLVVAWHGGCCLGGAGCWRRCMAMADGGSYTSGYGETFLGFVRKLFRRRQSAGDGGGWEREMVVYVCFICV